jgi:catecholate siderophore receptor
MQTSAENWGERIDKKGVAASLGFGLGTDDEIVASLYHLDYRNGINYGMPWLTPATGATDRVLVPVSAKNIYAAASDYNAGSADHATLAHTHRFGDGSELKTALRVGRYERDLRASAIRFAAAALQPGGQAVTAQTLSSATVLTRGNNLKIQNLDTVYLQSDYSTKFQALGLKHQVLAGMDAAKEDFENFGANALAKPNTTIGTPNDGGGVDESQRVTFLNRTFGARALGLYAQDLLQLSPHWKLLGGLRWDRFSGSYDSPTLTAANGTVTPATHRARTDSLWSKRLGLLWQPDAFQSWHLSYGTSFNTSGDTYQYDALGSNTPPEGSRNIELGGKFDLLDGRLSLRTALFHSVKTNERNRDAESVTPTTYVLSGQRHSAGLELDVAGKISPAWEVYVSYAFIPDAKIDKGVPAAGGTVSQSLQGEPVGSRPGLIPRHSGTVWTTYKIGENWRLGGGVNARSRVAPYQVTTFTAPGYATVDAMAEYTVGQLSYKLNISNLTDKLYADYLYRGHYIVGKPRSVQLQVNYWF